MRPPTPGAHVRITVEGIVQSAQSGEIELVSGTRVTYRSKDVQLEVTRLGFQPGDVVWDGSRNLLRVAPAGDEPHWIAPNGISVHDDEHDPSRLYLVATTEQPKTADRATILAEIDRLIEHCPEHGCCEPELELCHCDALDGFRRIAAEGAGRA